MDLAVIRGNLLIAQEIAESPVYRLSVSFWQPVAKYLFIEGSYFSH